jgi:hypothetical protein
MPLQVLDIKGVPYNRRERISAAVEAGGKHLSEMFGAWLGLDFDRKVRVILTGPGSSSARASSSKTKNQRQSPRW